MRAKRTDANQTEIVKALRKMGWSVYITSMVGNGFPDLVCGKRGINYLFEVKDGNKSKSAQKLTGQENLFHLTWNGRVNIITSIKDIIDITNQF